MKEIKYFTINGKVPYQAWYKDLGHKEQAVVEYALNSLANGNTGKAKNLKGGLWELRLHISSGLRVYFTYEGDKLIILLSPEDKGTQKRDIEQARGYLTVWRSL